MNRKARILVAEEEIKIPYVVAALEGYELIEATSIEQAQRTIVEDGIDMFVIVVQSVLLEDSVLLTG